MQSRAASLQIVTLFILSVFVSNLMDLDQLGAWYQSPVSPVMPGPRFPQPASTREPVRMFTESFWASLLPWVVVGLVIFGGFAWALVRLLRQFDAQDRQIENLAQDELSDARPGRPSDQVQTGYEEQSLPGKDA